MKEMALHSPFSLRGDDLILPQPRAIGLNPPFSLNNDDLAVSPQPVAFSKYRSPRRPGSRTPSFTSSASSLFCSPSSFLASASESPFHRLLRPSAVPFSWERQPGIPKLPSPAGDGGEKETRLLPLPPPPRSVSIHSRTKRSGSGDADPFAAALAQCAKESSPSSGDDIDALWWHRPALKSVNLKRRPANSDRISLVSFYGSCKTACSVSDATIILPRPTSRAAGSYGLLNRRSG